MVTALCCGCRWAVEQSSINAQVQIRSPTTVRSILRRLVKHNPTTAWETMKLLMPVLCRHHCQQEAPCSWHHLAFILSGGILKWELDSIVLEVQCLQPDPCGQPTNYLFVPEAVKARVLDWAHTSHFARDPGPSQTLDLIKRQIYHFSDLVRSYKSCGLLLPLAVGGHL